MKNHIITKIILIFFVSFLTVSCSKKNNDIDFDFSTLKKSKKVNEKKTENKFKENPDENSFIKDLVRFETIEKIQSKTEYGKINPFSSSKQKSNLLVSNFKLTGILNTKVKQFALVNFLDKKGAITKDSIGGLNTNLLPQNAKVINIDSQRMQLVIDYKNETFVFKLQN